MGYLILTLIIVGTYLGGVKLKRSADEDAPLRRAINNKASNMAKYGGKMVVGPRGGLREDFDTEEGKTLYHKSIIDKIRKESQYDDNN